jgi:hypothetical protein
VAIAFYVLSIAGLIGAFDVLYYHIYTCRLFTRRQSAAENVTHFIRALLFAAFFLTLMHVEARGAYWWFYPALVTVEMINSMFDTYLEKSSRADQGGLPHGEYCLHVVLSVLMGAVMTAMLIDSWSYRALPTAWVWRDLDVPGFLLGGGYFAMVMGVLFFFFEAGGVVRVLSKRQQTPVRTAAA